MAIVDAVRSLPDLENPPARTCPPAGIQHVALGGIGYPTRLAARSGAPAVLWFRGRLPRTDGPAVAIVGSRAASGAGCQQARALAAELARRGWAVISGGAFGIDAAAHEGALDGGGETFAVLGCGVDVVYPDRHERLFARIAAEGGGLLSELAPGEPPRRRHFPSRNRIVAALADAVVVVEAAGRSGALITARLARGQGRPVLAVAGSSGTDRLIRGGAASPVTNVDEIEAGIAGRLPGAQGSLLAPLEAPAPYTAVVAALRQRADDAPGLARRLGAPLPAVIALLVEAELEGWIRRVPGSSYEVTSGD